MMLSSASAAAVRARPTRITVPVALGLIVLSVGAIHAYLALKVASPWIVPDEIRYSELAKSLGDGGLPSIRGDVTFEFGLGYPLLLAPLWAGFDDVTLAYAAAKVLNALLLSLTAVPVYHLARRFVAEGSALIAAVLSVCIPSLLYAGTLMTEVALYPAFVLALLAIAVALERPTPTMQLAVFGTVALAATIKILAVSLLFGYLAGILVFHWLNTRSRSKWIERLGAYRTTWLVLAAMVVAGLCLSALAGQSPMVALGAYEPFLEATNVLAVPQWLLFHVAAFDLFVAVIPFAASALVVRAGFRGDADPKARLFAVMSLAMCAPVFVAVAAYSSSASPSAFGYASGAGANERATFVLAPFAVIGLVVWLRDRPGSPRAVVTAGLCAAALPIAVPLDRFSENVVKVQAFSLIPWVEASGTTHGRTGMVVASFLLGAAFMLFALTRAPDVAFVGTVAVALITVTIVAQSLIQLTSEWARRSGVGAPLTWVDQTARSESVDVLWYELPGSPSAPFSTRHWIVWLNEFYNRSIGKVYEIGSPMPYGVDLSTAPVRVERGRVVSEGGKPAPIGPLVLAPCYIRVEGELIARDPVTRAMVYRVSGAVRATTLDPGAC